MSWIEEAKKRAATQAVDQVESGMVLGARARAERDTDLVRFTII